MFFLKWLEIIVKLGIILIRMIVNDMLRVYYVNRYLSIVLLMVLWELRLVLGGSVVFYWCYLFIVFFRGMLWGIYILKYLKKFVGVISIELL